LRAALTAVQRAETATARQAADLAYFRVLIHCSRNRALGFLYRWVEHAFGGREHELTGGPQRRSRNTCAPARCE
jgi:GntR family transcriptional regulator, transcriptional repressor for pyruvate dehydrogenase complex